MLSSLCIDGLQAEVPYLSNLKCPSTPPRRLHHATFAMNQPPPPPCPPSPSGSAVSVTRSGSGILQYITGHHIDSSINIIADSTSSDAGFPWTPNSDRSSGACHIAYSAVEAGSPTQVLLLRSDMATLPVPITPTQLQRNVFLMDC